MIGGMTIHATMGPGGKQTHLQDAQRFLLSPCVGSAATKYRRKQIETKEGLSLLSSLLEFQQQLVAEVLNWKEIYWVDERRVPVVTGLVVSLEVLAIEREVNVCGQNRENEGGLVESVGCWFWQ